VGQGHALPTVILLPFAQPEEGQEFISSLKTTRRRARQGMALPHQLLTLGTGKTNCPTPASYLTATVTGALSNPATESTSGTASPGVMPFGT
jgi:hypothetical protein